MFVFIGGLIDWIVECVADVWLVRKRRSMRNQPDNTWDKAATDGAVLDGLLLILTVVATVGFVILHFMLGFSFALSFLLTGVPLALYGGYRWYLLLFRD